MLIVKKLAGQKLMRIYVRKVPVPLWVRNNNSDLSVLYQVFGEQECAVLLDFPANVIIDGGANVGYTSVFFALRYPNASILAVEPNSENCEIFKRNCAHFPNIELVKGAIWYSNTPLKIANPGDRSWMIKVQEAESPGLEGVPSFTIDNLLSGLNVRRADILKLDIEGAEKDLFSKGNLAWIDLMHCLIIETHGEQTQAVVLKAMESRGFVCAKSGEKLVFQRNTAS
ncbi:MAG: FkbM family methyltransferase [Verrucomicrobiota bacterium]